MFSEEEKRYIGFPSSIHFKAILYPIPPIRSPSIFVLSEGFLLMENAFGTEFGVGSVPTPKFPIKHTLLAIAKNYVRLGV